MEVNISDLTWDQFIYPREGKSEKTISAYIEALAVGDSLSFFKRILHFALFVLLNRPSSTATSGV